MLLIVRGHICSYYRPLEQIFVMASTYSKEEKAYLALIGNRIRELRLATNFSQEQLAFACGLDRTYIGSVERGERNISVLNLRKISKALKTEAFFLLKLKE